MLWQRHEIKPLSYHTDEPFPPCTDMFKLGIFGLEDYCPDPPGMFGQLRWKLTRHRISLRLLRTAIPASPQETAVFEALMQDLRLNSGIYRTTSHGRFRDLDRFVNELLVARFASTTALDVQDWAASDCLTSSEWAASLLTLFPHARLEASDLTLFLVEVVFGEHGERTVILERDGQPLQYMSPRFLINMNRREQRPRVLTRLMQKRVQSIVEEVNARLEIPAEWLDSDSDSLSRPPFMARKLPMVHPEAALFQARSQRFSISRHSAFEALSRQADVIRSMNIYNLGYFKPPQLKEGVKAVWSSLKPGGLWIVGRTWQKQPPSHDVSIFEKINGEKADEDRTDAAFRLVCRCGKGSEIESLVLQENRGLGTLAPDSC
jgi:hypothetical protein